MRDGIDMRLEQAAQDRRAWQDIVDETVARLSGAWADENLDEEMRDIRGRWNRREALLGKGWRRGS